MVVVWGKSSCNLAEAGKLHKRLFFRKVAKEKHDSKPIRATKEMLSSHWSKFISWRFKSHFLERSNVFTKKYLFGSHILPPGCVWNKSIRCLAVFLYLINELGKAGRAMQNFTGRLEQKWKGTVECLVHVDEDICNPMWIYIEVETMWRGSSVADIQCACLYVIWRR